MVRGVAEGKVTITASSGNASGRVEIVVQNPDRAALVALFEATDGPNWINSENWLTDAPLGEWYGVRTDRTGRVLQLDLAGKWDREESNWTPHGLSGPIPTELANLVNLVWLSLSENNLTGPIPVELANLAQLRVLSLKSNELEGRIPSSSAKLGPTWKRGSTWK